MRFPFIPRKNLLLADTKPADIGKRLGHTGTTNYGGLLSDIDYNNDWQAGYGSPKWNLIDEMRFSDGQVAGTLEYCTKPVLAAEWTVEAASEDRADEEIADFVRWNLFECPSFDWEYTLYHFLLALPMGFMVFEKCWEYDRDSGRVYCRSLEPRLPKTIYRWNEKDGALDNIEQLVTSATTKPIPAAKLVVFTPRKEGGNYEGISVLRSAYKSFKIKLAMETIAAMSYERFGMGVPVFTESENTSEEERKLMDACGENLRAAESAFVRKPYGTEFEILFGTNWKSPAAEVKYHNEMISAGVLQQFTNLGSSQTGSRAVGEVLQDPYFLSLQACAKAIAKRLNNDFIPELVSYNFSGVKALPQVKCDRITAKSITEVADALSKLATAGLILGDDDTENYLRKMLGLPERKEPRTPSVTPKPEDVKEDQGMSEGCSCGDAHSLALAEGFRREMRDFERCVQFAEIKRDTEDAARQMAERLKGVRAKQMKLLASDLAKMAESGRIDPTKVKVPLMGKATDVIKAGMREQYDAGRNLVQEELKRQKATQILKARASGERVLKEPVPKPPKSISRSAPDFEDVLANRADLVAEGSNSQLRMAALAKMPAIVKQASTLETAISAEKLIEFFEEHLMLEFERLSLEHLVLSCRGAIMEALNEGRADQAAEMAAEFAIAYRSGLLDEAICPVCEDADGQEYSVEDAVNETLPDPECEGGDRCRCLMVFVSKEEEIAIT